jgi:hypothetical protein
MTRMALSFLIVLLLAAPALAGPQTLILDPQTGATAYDVEVSTDNGVTWTVMVPQLKAASCSATQCTYAITPPNGRTLYRWAVFTGTTRTLRTDAGVYLCVGLADCPLAPSGVGVK